MSACQNENRYGKNRTGPVFYKLAVSFLLMLVIPFVILLMNYARTRGLLQEEYVNYQDAMLAQVQMHIDERLNGLSAAALDTSQDETIIRLLSGEKMEGGALATGMVELINIVRRHEMAYGNLSNFYLYSFQYDRLIYAQGVYTDITGRGAAILDDAQLNAQFLTDLQGSRYFCQYKTLSNTQGECQLVMYHTLPLWSTNHPVVGTLCLCVDEQALFTDVEAVQELRSGLVCLIDKSGFPVAATGDSRLLAYAAQALEAGNPLHIDKKEYTVTTRPCTITGWSYLSIQPQDLLLTNLRQSRNFSLALFTVTALIGIGLTLLLTNRNYQPVRQLMDSLRKRSIIINEQLNSGENEYALIERSVEDIATSMSVVHSALQQEMPHIQHSALAQLFHGGVTDYTEFHSLLSDIGILLPYRKYCVTLLRLCGDGDGNTEEGVMFTLVLREQLMQTLPRTITFAAADMRQDITAVLFNSDLPDFESQLRGAVYAVQQTMRRDFGWMLTICASETLTALEQVPRAYSVTRRILSAQPDGKLTLFSGTESSLRTEQNLDEFRPKLQNYIASGAKQDIQDLLRNMHARFFGSGEISDPYAVQAYYINLLNILTNAYPLQGPLPLALGSDSPMERLFRAQNPDEMLEIVCSASDLLCDSVQKSQRDHATRLTEDILSFLDREYANSELSLTYVAEHFYITPSYLSAFFRKNVGETFLNYLTKLRIEKAKELLRTTNRPIAEVAALTGYASGNTFTRIFKKSEGITPTRYRENGCRPRLSSS